MAEAINSKEKYIVHVEILQTRTSELDTEVLKEEVIHYLTKDGSLSSSAKIMANSLPKPLSNHCISIDISTETQSDIMTINASAADLHCYVYQLEECEPVTEELNTGGDDASPVPAATHWLLPAAEFDNLWDTLYFDMDIKNQLLRFVNTALLFADRGINVDIISWNRVVLLHGPPGTGKTSLCKALAHKLSIRLSDRYTYGQLIEINSHSLFSKWFSESGKLVQQLFSKLQELVSDPSCLVIVLIDEVESLTRSRTSSSASTEPGDAVRVVNALLTQLDLIKRHPNVLILTTSNISETVDLAFVDRADIKQYIGLPSTQAIYQIYYSCLKELAKAGIITDHLFHLFTLHRLKIIQMSSNDVNTKHSDTLMEIARESQGLSGRTLRKIPFLAHALHITGNTCSLEQFMDALRSAVIKQKKDREQLGRETGKDSSKV